MISCLPDQSVKMAKAFKRVFAVRHALAVSHSPLTKSLSQQSPARDLNSPPVHLVEFTVYGR